MKKLMEETTTQKLYWDNDNNVVWGELTAERQDLATATENIDAQERLRDSLNRQKTRVMIDMRQTTRITREARQYYANERTASIQSATALLVGSSVTVMIANFFMGLNKPLTPTRMFREPGPAIEWLKGFPDA